jgi:hypothetical protein
MRTPPEISQRDYDRILTDISRLEADPALPIAEAEKILGDVLEPILRSEGFGTLQVTPRSQDSGIDFKAFRDDVASGSAESVGVATKCYRRDRKVSVKHVRELMGAAALEQDAWIGSQSSGEGPLT